MRSRRARAVECGGRRARAVLPSGVVRRLGAPWVRMKMAAAPCPFLRSGSCMEHACGCRGLWLELHALPCDVCPRCAAAAASTPLG